MGKLKHGKAPSNSAARLKTEPGADHIAPTLHVRLEKVEVVPDEHTGAKPSVAMTFSCSAGEGRGSHSTAIPPGFDPWTTSEDEFMQLVLSGKLPAQHPACAQWGGAQIVMSNRKKIESSGTALLEAMTIIARQGLVMPPWMAETYIRCFLKIQRLEVSTLDEAFGHKPMKRLAAGRQRRKLIPTISKLLMEALQKDPTRAIGKDLFEEIGQMPGIGKSATFVEEAYYEGVRDHGMQDLSMLKKLKIFPYK